MGLSGEKRERRRGFFLGVEHSETRRVEIFFGAGETEEGRKNVSESKGWVLERKTIENLRFGACRRDFLKHFGCPCILEDSTSPNYF